MHKSLILPLIWIALSLGVSGQSAGILRGTVADETGAAIPGAQITISGEAGVVRVVTSGDDGSYSANGLADGIYTVRAAAPGLTQFQPASVEMRGAAVTLTLSLRLVLEKQEITVADTVAGQVGTDPGQSAAAVVMREDNIEALADDPDDLQADLLALAGPAAGPSGGQIYIDGFTNGDAALPSKDAIREIRVNQNPFSPEYDALGFGRTEILTKPGRDKFRGQAYFNYGNGIFNSRNPYAPQKAPLDLNETGGNVSGPLGKNASAFFEIDDRHIDNGAVVNAVTVDPKTLAILDPYTLVYSSPTHRFRVSPRVDWQLGANHTLMFRYALTRTGTDGSGIGGFSLPSVGITSLNVEHAFQGTETWVISPHVVDETHFQFLHQHMQQNSPDSDPSIQVLSAFTGGGPPNPAYWYIHHHYEFQNYVSIVSGRHTWKAGIRVRAVSIQDSTNLNFDGAFTFGGAYAPILDSNNQPLVPGMACNAATPTPGCQTISSIEQYRRTLLFTQMGLVPAQIRLLGGGASQFTLATGNPLVLAGQSDTGLFVGDEWRLRPNFNLSLGLRWETQTNIHGRDDFAPRLGFAWGLGGTSSKSSRPKTVIRSGFGIFYDRFSEQNILIAERFNSRNQQKYVVTNPDFFPNIPQAGYIQGLGIQQAINTVSPMLVAPYVVQAATGIERQLPRNTTLALTYTVSHGLHELMTRNINAPLNGVVPFAASGPIYEMESAGLYNQNQLVLNMSTRVNPRVTFSGFYVLNFARSNTDGINTYPANQYSLAGEYGPAASDIRNRGNVSGTITTRYGFRLSPFLVVQSGAPFDITTSQDIYDSTVYTARPGIANNPSKSGLVSTSYGLLDPNPSPGETVLPRNSGRGPGLFSVDLRLARTFALERKPRERKATSTGGPAGTATGATPAPGPERRGSVGGFDNAAGPSGGADAGGAAGRYSLTFSISARNVFNHVNPGPIVGNINSPLFGQSNQIAGGFGAFSGSANNRRVEFQVRLAF